MDSSSNLQVQLERIVKLRCNLEKVSLGLINQSINQSVNQSVSQTDRQTVSKSVSQPVSQSMTVRIK